MKLRKSNSISSSLFLCLLLSLAFVFFGMIWFGWLSGVGCLKSSWAMAQFGMLLLLLLLIINYSNVAVVTKKVAAAAF